MTDKYWDVFICHASEDKESVARPLTESLERAGARVWLDENEVTLGDSLSETIDQGLAQSEFGAVIVSPAFFAKHWTRKELSGLRMREERLIDFFTSTFALGTYPHLFGLIFKNPWLHFGVEFGDHTYDLAVYYVNHGIRFELVVFTVVTSDPFESPKNSQSKIDQRILNAVADVRATKNWFETDPRAATSMLLTVLTRCFFNTLSITVSTHFP